MDSREQLSLPEDYFDKIFHFAYKHGYFFHPMVGADNIENWIQNYDWWRDMIKKYNEIYHYNQIDGHYLPMMLEVRNDNWTIDTIQLYLNFIDHMIEDRFAMCNYNLEEFTNHVYMINYTLPPVHGYDPISLIEDLNNQNLLCDLQNCIHIQMNDLTIVPCHRTTYSQFQAGKFIVENNRIIDIEPLNVNLWLTIMNLRRTTLPYCSRCYFQPYCIAGCLGAQFETNGELFCPCISVCELFRAKFCYILYKYEKMGVLETAERLGYISPREKENYKRIQDCGLYCLMRDHDGQYK